MSINLAAEQNEVQEMLEFVDNYCGENGCDDGYADLTLGDIEYLAEELNVHPEYLIALLRENY